MSYDVTIRRQDMYAILDLKGRPEDLLAILAGVGLSLPATPNTSTRAGDREFYWIGPDHGILRSPITSEQSLLQEMQAHDVPPGISQVQVSDSYVFFEIFGPDATQVLAIASPLDTHPSVFPENGAAFTETFGLKALVIRRDEGFELAVDLSFADMTEDYLERITSVKIERPSIAVQPKEG